MLCSSLSRQQRVASRKRQLQGSRASVLTAQRAKYTQSSAQSHQ